MNFIYSIFLLFMPSWCGGITYHEWLKYMGCFFTFDNDRNFIQLGRVCCSAQDRVEFHVVRGWIDYGSYLCHNVLNIFFARNPSDAISSHSGSNLISMPNKNCRSHSNLPSSNYMDVIINHAKQPTSTVGSDHCQPPTTAATTATTMMMLPPSTVDPAQ
jgi:hypothetical protein